MGDLIFVLPTFIIFFIILLQVFSLIRRAFDFVRKNFDLTIDQAGEEIKKRSGQINQSFDRAEVEDRIAEAEKESLAESKERILAEQAKKRGRKSQELKNKKNLKENRERKKQKQNGGSLGEIFAQYNEVEKAVIYHEILSKPKALKRD